MKAEEFKRLARKREDGVWVLPPCDRNVARDMPINPALSDDEYEFLEENSKNPKKKSKKKVKELKSRISKHYHRD